MPEYKGGYYHSIPCPAKCSGQWYHYWYDLESLYMKLPPDGIADSRKLEFIKSCINRWGAKSHA